MILKINNKRIIKHFEEIKLIQENINEVVKVLESKDKELGVLSKKKERVMDKVRPLVAEEIKKLHKMGEFEVVGSSKLEGGFIEASIFDQVEEYKKALRERKNEEQSKN